jgi:hypothetical protein
MSTELRTVGTRGAALLVLVAACGTSGCTRKFEYQPLGMWNGSRLKPMEGSPMPGRISTASLPVPGTVARGQLYAEDVMLTGRSAGRLVAESPLPRTHEVLERGQERYNVYCSPCHSRLGDGLGMIVQRGFPHPPDYAIKRLRQAPIGHFFDVMTNGYGVMYSYADRVPVKDRWAIAEYIRVIQASRKEVPEDIYEAERERARMSGIHDPNRPMRLEEHPGAAPESARPGEEPHGGPGAGPGGMEGGAHGAGEAPAHGPGSSNPEQQAPAPGQPLTPRGGTERPGEMMPPGAPTGGAQVPDPIRSRQRGH